MKYCFIIVNLIFLTQYGFSQKADSIDYPTVGKPISNLTLRNIHYYSKKEAHIEDFRGKWLLLDFWDIHCSGCIASFPYINDIQQKLGDSIQVMLVNMQDTEGLSEPMYAKFRKRQHLVLPCAFDSTIFNELDLYLVPHSILIDRNGIVRCVTTSFSITDIQGFLSGEPPVMPKTYRRMQELNNEEEGHYAFKSDKPFLLNGNGGNDSDFLFRSILSAWDKNSHRQFVPHKINEGIKWGRFQVLGAPLEWLYNYAYFGQARWFYSDTAQYGKNYIHPVLEISDSSMFDYSFKFSKNIYSYSVIMPPKVCSERSMKKALLQDLETYFGFESNVEIRKCPCWKLIAQKGAKEKLETKGKRPYYRRLFYGGGFTARCYSFKKLVTWIMANQQENVIIDETKISGNIDITLDCIPTDFQDLQNALHSNGLDLVLSEIPMSVVVIRDRKDSISLK